MSIEIGQPVPDFSASATGDTTVTLAERQAGRHLLLPEGQHAGLHHPGR